MDTSIDQWTYFIKNAEILKLMPDNVQDEGLQEAYTEANQQNWTKDELDDYLRASIKERDEIGRIEFAERKGRNEGIIEGEIRGEIKGEIKGRIKVAKSLKMNGIDIDLIVKTTGLTKEEIEKL